MLAFRIVHIFTFIEIALSLYGFLVTSWCSFIATCRNLVRTSLRTNLVVTDFLRFCLFGNISSSRLRDISYQIWDSCLEVLFCFVSFLWHFKYMTHCLWLSMFLVGKLLMVFLRILCMWCHLSFSAFKILSSSLSFYNLITVCLGLNLFEVIQHEVHLIFGCSYSAFHHILELISYEMVLSFPIYFFNNS